MKAAFELKSSRVCEKHSKELSFLDLPRSNKALLMQKPEALAPNVCSRVTRKSEFFHANHMLVTLNFSGSDHWAPFNFPKKTASRKSVESFHDVAFKN